MATPRQITMIAENLRVDRKEVAKLDNKKASNVIAEIQLIYKRHKGGDPLKKHFDLRKLAEQFGPKLCSICLKPTEPINTPNTCSC